VRSDTLKIDCRADKLTAPRGSERKPCLLLGNPAPGRV